MNPRDFGRWRAQQRARSIGERLAALTGIEGDAVNYAGDALSEIDRVMKNPDHPYWKGDKAAVAAVTNLYKQAYPDERRHS
jgi:hypothetical protein